MESIELHFLKPEDEAKIHPHALKLYKDWLSDIGREIPLQELHKEDLSAYLTEEENVKFKSYVDEIGKWLSTCLSLKDWYSLLPFSTYITFPMAQIKLLLKKGYQTKIQKLEEPKKSQEIEKKLWSAYKALNPPVDDARKYLSPGECHDFKNSIGGVLLAYYDHGKDYTRDERAVPYLSYVQKIESKKKECEVKANAQLKAKQFIYSLNEEIAMLKSSLYANRQSPESLFKKQINDRRCSAHSFSYLLPTDVKQRCDAAVKNKVHTFVPEECSQFFHLDYSTSYFLFPHAEYKFDSMPCLNFSFDIFAVIEIKVWIKPAKRTIDGHVFTFPWPEQCGGLYLTELKEPQFLGYGYQLLSRTNLGNTFWQRIPVVLILSLLDGDSEPVGTSIITASEYYVTYKVEGLDREIIIPVDFMNYLKEINTLDQMVKIGIISDQVASIVKKRIDQPATDGKVPPLPNEPVKGFTDEEFISSLTNLGIPRKDTEMLLSHVPRTQTLSEAAKLALQKYKEIIAERNDDNASN